MYFENWVECVISSFCNILFLDLVKFWLVGGSDVNSGCIEVNLNGLWGIVCDDEFNIVGVKIVCK